MNHAFIANAPDQLGKAIRCLTHLVLDKMATILADDNFKCIFLNENERIPIRISLTFVPRIRMTRMTNNGSGNGLVPNRRQSITWTNADAGHCRKYAVLGKMS